MSARGHSELEWFSLSAPGAKEYFPSSDGAHHNITCGHCGRTVSAAVLVRTQKRPLVLWLRCPGCGRGSVINEDTGQIPRRQPGGSVAGLPAETEAAYAEARAAASVGAWTGVEMLCRKILMHVAVDKGAAAGKSFAFYLDYLQEHGYVPAVMREWVDFIRRHGNDAAHELPAVTEDRGAGTLVFTEQLLKSTYEMAELARRFAAPPRDPG